MKPPIKAARLSGAFPATVLAFYLILALLTRYGALGDRAYAGDEQLFLYIGKSILHGAIPYVDVWDRKPVGLFLLYAVFSGISPSPWSFQIGSLIAVSATALALGLLARDITQRGVAAYISGAIYIVALLPFDGRSGEAGVFAALPMAWAAWIVLTERRDKWGWLAMLLAGLAITIKQTTLFEGLFLGLVLVWHGRHQPVQLRLRQAAAWIALGAAPMAAIAAFYGFSGHWDAYWAAMVGANLRKVYNPGGELLHRYGLVARLLLPLLTMAALGWRAHRGTAWWTITGWFGAALIGMLAVPNMLGIYAIPLLAPLSVLAAVYATHSRIGLLLAVLWIAATAASTGMLDFSRASRSNALMQQAEAEIQSGKPHPRLFVFDGPMALYHGNVATPPTPLIFPLHLSYAPERNVSQFSTRTEVTRILHWNPDVVVIQDRHRAISQVNQETDAMVASYVMRCRRQQRRPLENLAGPYTITIHSQCAARSDHP